MKGVVTALDKIMERERSTEVRTLTDLVKYIENTLGWAPSWDDPRPLWKIRAIEVAKIKRAIRTQRRPKDYTVANLMVAVEFLRRRNQHIESPVAVVYAVERALKRRADRDSTDLETAVERAVAEANRLGRDDWARRIARATGGARAEVLREWEEARG